MKHSYLLKASTLFLFLCVLAPGFTWSQTADQTTPTTQSTSATFPPGEVLVILANDNADILTNPAKDSALQAVKQKYGSYTVKQTFPFAGKIQGDANIQGERFLQKYSLRQKFTRAKLSQPKIPALHRFYNLSFGTKVGDVSNIVLDLKKSLNIKDAGPNVVLKAMAKVGSAYYSPTMVWAGPYASWFGISTTLSSLFGYLKSGTVSNALTALSGDMSIPTKTYATTPSIPGYILFTGRPPIAVDSCTPQAPLFKKLCAANELLVRFKDGVTDATIAALHAPKSITIMSTIPLIKVKKVKLPASMTILQGLAFYAANSNVLYAEPNYLGHSVTTTPNDPEYTSGQQWALDNNGGTFRGNTITADADIDVPEAWDYTTGSDAVVVAVIDSGIDLDHEDYYDPFSSWSKATPLWTTAAKSTLQNSNIWMNQPEWDYVTDSSSNCSSSSQDGNEYVCDMIGWDFYDNDNLPQDRLGHGTPVASIIGARGNNALVMTGVAWNVKIMPLKIEGGVDEISSDTVASAITYACKNGAQIANMSFVFDNLNTPWSIQDALDLCTSVLFVAAAGNDGNDNDSKQYFPASFSHFNILSVAASDYNDALSVWSATESSNYGATLVDVAAPGTSIEVLTNGNSYDFWNGTSMAAPQVSGIAALLYSYFPGMDAYNAKDLIMRSVDVKTALTGKVASNGRVNAYNALKLGVDEGWSSDDGVCDGEEIYDPVTGEAYSCWPGTKSGCSLTMTHHNDFLRSRELLQLVLVGFFLGVLFIGFRQRARS